MNREGERRGRPRKCRYCGGIIGSQENRCSWCGKADTPLAAPWLLLPRLLSRTGLPTRILLGIMVVWFLAMILNDGGLRLGGFGALLGGGFSNDTLFRFGVLHGPSVRSGQWWRLVTFNFQHLGLAHIAFNGYALWMLGPLVEMLFGAAGFTLLFTVTGIASSLASILFGLGGAGASGALFGFIGAILVRARRGRTGWDAVLASQAGSWALMAFVFTFLIPNVNIVAHVVGFAAGAGLAWILPLYPGSRPRWVPLAGGASAVVLLAGIVACAWHLQDPTLGQLDRAHEGLLTVERAVRDRRIRPDGTLLVPRDVAEDALAALRDLPRRHRTGDGDPGDLARLLEEGLRQTPAGEPLQVPADPTGHALDSGFVWLETWIARLGLADSGG